ncbi:sugar kinase [Actinoplanes sp. N902-109]|uniref:sugar kinase n=1 Tax=Actinoplanes sp. (strain N902-109) TaxID=649831 RepID=UPI0003296741|nr:sugar kinase [Actinoplanes sp. N902-109]AGL19192.1 sugar kinase, ribokinase family [Actinoplanes sp. N902-109]
MIDRIVTLGEALAVFRTGPGGPLWQARHVELSTGGAEANVAMAVARRGVPVSWFGRVGADELGRRVVRELRAEGVDVHATVDREHPTGLLVKDIRPGGRTSVGYYRRDSAGSRLEVADVDRIPLDAGALLHLTGITPGLSAGCGAAVARLAERATAAGATLSFDVNHRRKLWSDDSAAPVYRALAARADLLFASVEEVPLLLPGWTGTQADAAARALAGRGHRQVVVTAGARGAYALIDGTGYEVAAVPLDGIVDTVGAGDAFVGGYLAELVAGSPVRQRLRTAAVLGAAACRHPGDWEGVADTAGLEPDGVPADPVSR